MIIFWILVLYGTTQIIVESSLFKPLRNVFNVWFWTRPIHILLTCMMCISTWLGFIYSYHWWSPVEHIFKTEFNYYWFLDGMFGSCAVWFISLFEKALRAIIVGRDG